ncbi:PepSY-associated TM helix domain-containing protein [Sphingosinicella ginsenosidimutans]|uniref:PepSY domain-containing protein n=1 Tax=Allosphingosinicella ginsenosidimutans TaxID=1176539 RepID=A0A5C6TTA1_9SPHN|nr:PepSY-associated TM helix domain-containing protein [Sphingosinicella ginsenosidimutans]TXC63633.1 PepSY domain-containing protein [Sphingosinicella ginsenosidimutans]
MRQSTTLRLRGWWLQVHKWIGLILAILIIPLCVSGAALVWDGALDKVINPGRYAVTGAPGLPPSAYEAAARAAIGADERLVSIRYPGEEGGPIVASAAKAGPRDRPGARRGGGGDGAAPAGPPRRTNVWIDPGSGRVLDVADSNSGLIRVLHRIHGSFMVPGWGRTIVGVVGVAMLLSCLTGLWLWWPVAGSVRRGFRWRRQNSTSANLHHLIGFWILLPLAMLSFTGAWISFPQFFGRFEAAAPRGGDGPPDRARAARARPLESPRLTVDAALAAAHPDGALATIAWPTDQSPRWRIAFARDDAPPAEYGVDDATGEVTPPRPPRPETNARLMRRWHDGTGMGPVWQTLIFLGGVIPAALAVTGIIMWLRNRGWRAKLKSRRRTAKVRPAVQPAE